MSHHPTKPNESAFPVPEYPGSGLTKREYFAAMALNGFITKDFLEEETASYAVAYADALIAALNKEPKEPK